jgi:hypothetical protein
MIAPIACALMAAGPSPLVVGLDHTPIAVRDLDQAAADFSRLGFLIKPGRPHNDGIRNRHVKFPNGGEIELITAASPTDALAKDYADWLQGGDGPAYWSLYSPDLRALTAFLSRRKLDPSDQGDLVTFSQAALPHRLFFADRLRSPTDGPVYWDHPNTAYKLARVWLAGTAKEADILPALGAEPSAVPACSPFESRGIAYVFPSEGDAVVLAPDVRRSDARSIIGVTVLVEDLATAERILEANHIRYQTPKACENTSLWVAPSDAYNVWLELSQRRPG